MKPLSLLTLVGGLTFATSLAQAGSVARLIYDGVTGTTVGSLTNALIFPGSPTFREQLDDFTPDPFGAPLFGLQGKDNSFIDFGSWIRGYIEAPTNGVFTFSLASDDASELWFSTNHLATNATRIAAETVGGAPLFSGARLSERTSAPFTLVRGQKYYFEVLHKQNSGASYVQIGWQRPDGVQETIPALHLAQHPLDPWEGRTNPNLAPTVNAAGLNGGNLPGATNATEGGTLLLQVDVIAAQPATFQWLSNGVPIAGENLSFLRWGGVPLSADGAAIQVLVTNQFGAWTSAATTLSVTPDATPLGVLSVDHRGNPNGLRVRFTKPLNPATATALANYALDDGALPITTATLLADGVSVQLGGDFAFAVNSTHTLTIQNVEDTAVIPNGLSPSPTNIGFSFSGPNLGPVGFAANLTNVSVLENRPVHLEVGVSGALPYSFQWFYEEAPIAGATNRSLQFLGSYGKAGRYQVVVSNEFSSATSAVATLTIQPDTIAPKLVGIRGLAGGLNEVRLKFDELIDPLTAASVATYRIGYLPIYSAVLSPNGSNVVLRTGTLQKGQVYVLEINGLRDPSVASNALSTTAAFVAEVDYFGELLVDAPVRHFTFNESIGSATVASLVSVRDALSSTPATLVGNPALGAASLVSSDPEGTAIQFTAANLHRVTVPNGSDLNATAGPWAKKSIEFWFRANSLPAPGTSGLAATAGLWEQGAATRNLSVYLWRDPANADPNSAHIVLNAVNNASDGAGAPYGPPANPAVCTLAPIQAGQTYHVVAVFDGDATGTNGSLILYLNGVEAARGGGAGQLYNHTGDIRIGHGNGLIHTGQNGAFGYFDGVIDSLTLYNRALSAQRVAVHYASSSINPSESQEPLSIVDVDTRGNPQQVLVTFNKPVSGASAANLSNYALQQAGGAPLPISTATLLGGDRTVLLSGNLNLQLGSNYVLTVGNVTDQAQPPAFLTPNPTNVAFTFGAPAPAVLTFDGASPNDVQFYGNAGLVPSGSHDGSGYLRLTDATNSQNGYVLFTERHDVDQFHLRFKTRISDASLIAADGFSVNLAADLPTATFGTAEEGYAPLATVTADRLIVAFDNFASNSGDPSPSIAVKWRGVVLTNVLTGTNGIPALHNTSGAWVGVDIRLRRGGWLSVVYDNVVVISNLFTGIDILVNAQLGIAARTGGSFETHWIDDLLVNYDDGAVGPVGIGSDSELANVTAVENQIIRFSIAPTGAGPFAYQWYLNGAPIPGATERALIITATTNVVGHYHAVVWNEFSQVASAAATLLVNTDFTPPAIEQATGLAGSLHQVRIRFSEPVDSATATNLGNYSIAGITLLGAEIAPDGYTVTLRTRPLVFRQVYTVAVSGVKDQSAAGNVLNGQAQFAATVRYADEVLADAPVRYYRLGETNGVTAFSETSLLDNLLSTPGTYAGTPALNHPSLVPNAFENGAVLLRPSTSSRVTIPSGTDLNITAGPWEKKTIEFWFRASSVPAPGTTGANAAAGLFEQGAGTRGLSIYLYRDPSNTNAAQADLYFNGWNNAVADGLGSPWGVPGPAKYVRATISTGVTYHVVAVLDGGTNLSTGQLLLYTNGVEVGRQGGVGRLFIHNSDIQIGRGNTLLHTATTTTAVVPAFFDGVVDEVALYNTALSSNKVATHFVTGNVNDGPPVIEGIRIESGLPVIRWNGSARLQHSTNATGPFIDVPGAFSPYQVPAQVGDHYFYRLAR